MRIVLAFAFALLLPLSAHAALNAGVINGVWFSNPSPEAGESVRIYTAVQNSSDATVTGTVAFLVNGEIVGTAKFSVTSNDAVPVSTEYIFEDGAYDVSAYITSSDDSVAYTIAPDTSVSVVRKAPTTPQESANTTAATTTLKTIAETVTQKSKETLDSIQPVAEQAAQRIESFRDSFVQPTASTSQATPEEDVVNEQPAAASEKDTATHTFVTDSKRIVESDVPMWKKAAGVGLSFVALLLRFWFVFLILLVGFVFWKLTRGSRIV